MLVEALFLRLYLRKFAINARNLYTLYIIYIFQAHGKIEIPVTAKAGLHPSMYTGHPSYAYPPGRDYATDRSYPGNEMYAEHSYQGECPGRPEAEGIYPLGAPPLSMHQGGPAPTGFC